MPSERWSRWAIITIVFLFIVLGTAYSVANPLFEATDELRHYRFVQHIIQHHALPIQGEMNCSAQGHHPPLYYATAALVTGWIDSGHDVCYEPPKNPFWDYRYWEVGNDNKNQYLHGQDEAFPWSGNALAAHLSRIVNVFIGAAVVWVTWAIGRAIWPKRPFLAVGGAAIVAFNPMFLFMSGAVNNDVIAALAGAAVTLASMRLIRDEEGLRTRWGIILGILFGLALMSKFNLAAIIVTIELALTWVAWRKKQWARWIRANILLFIFSLLVAGWWFVRNQILYGEPTGFQRLTELWGVRNPADSFGVAIFELPYLWTSLWGRFGYGQVPLPQPIYLLLWWFSLFAAVGLLLPLILRQRDELRDYGILIVLLLLNVALFFAVIFNYLLVSPAGPMGRFFFPALPSFALLLFYGLSRWGTLWLQTKDRNQREDRTNLLLAGFVSGGFLVLALVALFGYLAPAYARPPAFSAGAAIPNPVNMQFEPFARLHGYEIKGDTVYPGGAIDVDLYLEVIDKPPGNYLLFVHLIDDLGIMVSQRDTHPGLGNFPTSQWEIGDRFIESIRLYIPETAYTPSEAALSVGFYAAEEGYRLPVTSSTGELIGDAFEIGKITLIPSADVSKALPNAQNQNFDDAIALKGYEYSERAIDPGSVLAVHLYWQALQNDLPDYKVQLRLLDETGKIMEDSENRPQDGQSATTTWKKDDLIMDTHLLWLDDSLPPGTYFVQVALLDVESGERLNIIGEDGHWIDNRLRLAGLKLLP